VSDTASRRPPPSERLRFLAETVQAEAQHLATTDGCLFAQAMTAERAASLVSTAITACA